MKQRTALFISLATLLILFEIASAADRRKPLISNVQAGSLTTTSAVITWNTNEMATSQTDYGLTTSYEKSTALDATRVQLHQMSLTGLTANTLYNYRVKSKDASGNLATSSNYTFRTSSITDPPPPPSGPAKAFPGAVGFGSNTPGGRGGSILKVTNLNNSGTGSLRAAIDATGKRTVIFEVSGTVQLASELKIRNPYITIAGQTAPSPGITLRGAELNIKSHDVIIQHLRIRVGDIQPGGIDIGGVDTVSVDGPGTYNVVLDHLSISWGIDENASSWYSGVQDVTMSNCIISEALYNSIHPEGIHSMGLLVTPNGRNVALIGNLLAHNSDRNPLVSNGASSVIANNLFYNWKGGRATNIGNSSSTYPAQGPTLVSVVGNSYIGGVDTPSTTYAISDTTSLNTGSQIYYSDNKLERVTAVFRHLASFNTAVSVPPITLPGFTALPSSSVTNSVLTNAGARPASRDAVDARIISHVQNRNGKIINSQSEVGGWPNLPVNYHTISVPSNANADDDGDGYTNFEEQVLFPMAAQVEGKS